MHITGTAIYLFRERGESAACEVSLGRRCKNISSLSSPIYRPYCTAALVIKLCQINRETSVWLHIVPRETGRE